MQFLKTIKTIILSLIALIYITNSSNAMQFLGKIRSHPHLGNMRMRTIPLPLQRNYCTSIQPKFEKIPITKQGYVSAKARLHLLQHILKRHPNLTINTQIPSADNLWQLYEQDKNFIKKSIKNRSNAAEIQKSLEHVHLKALEAGWNETMCISDLVFTGEIWCSLLSSSPESQIHALYDMKRKKNVFWNANFTTRSELTNYLYIGIIDMDFERYLKNPVGKPWQRIPGFMIPHVSPTGSVPLSVMQEAWGFFTEEGTNKASYIDFLAVPTNPVVSFDYEIDFPPYDAWQHDLAHVRDCRSGTHNYLNRSETLNLAQKTASILSAINKATLSHSDHQSINIAFFHVFHEAGSPVMDLARRIKVLESKNEIKLRTEIIPSIYFESLEQYKLYVESTERMLGHPLVGDTLLDKYRSYVNITLEGLMLLKKFAHHYDESFPI